MIETYIPVTKWRRLTSDLWIRSEGMHESGAFLLGFRDGKRRCVVEWILNDDVDPHCLNTGIVILDGQNLGTLWKYCRNKSLEVVADVHTHLGGAGQSVADRENPMIAIPGHIALIVPQFSKPPVDMFKLGIYEYLGEKRWQRLPSTALVTDLSQGGPHARR